MIPHPLPSKPKLAVWKFASCDGCQLSLLDCEDELLNLSATIEIAYFLEATRAQAAGPYDLSLVEGSITTADDERRIREIRRVSRKVVTIGACATAGGIQALRNFGGTSAFIQAVYARPEYIDTLETSTPIAAHISVDFELHGCPINKHQLLDVVLAFVMGRKPNVAEHSVCMECKVKGNTCVLVAHHTPCLGPITRAGCGALCPAFDRGCYGCFGPSNSASPEKLTAALRNAGCSEVELQRLFSTFHVAHPALIPAHRLTRTSPKDSDAS